jgi:hypothetical protein
MHVYYLRAIITFNNIKSNDNTNKLINQKLLSLWILLLNLHKSLIDNIKLILKFYISKNNFILKLTCFILINSCLFSNQFFKNLILIRFKGIEANHLYVYQTNFIFKISHMDCFLHFKAIWNLAIQKGKRQPKNNNDIETRLNQLPNK